MNKNLIKVVLSTLICNSLIWYDYALYGSLIVIISDLFFPGGDHFIKLMEAFGVFAIGFLMRPVGAMLFGHFGDVYSRKYALLFSIISMSVPMLFIAMLPTYDAIGIAAPILLILVRLIQGLALGGEAGNAAFLIEYAPQRHRGLICSFEVLSAIVGSIMSTIIIVMSRSLVGEGIFYDWGWRLPFVFGVVIGIVGMFLRYITDESPAYQNIKEVESHTDNIPLKELAKNHKKNFFVAIGIDSVEEASLYVFLIFFNLLIGDMYADTQYVKITHLISMVVLGLLTIAFASISDRYGRKKVMLTSFITLLVVAYPMFWMITQNNLFFITLAQLMLAIITAAALGPVSAAALELFPMSVRYSGFAISRNIAAAIFGGMAPIICTFLIHTTGSKTSAALYLMFTALIGIISFLFFKDKHKKSIL